MLRGLIAEIGNHHFGDLAKAKELIRASKDAGADFAKMQAIDPLEFTGGSMVPEFYETCDLGLSGYQECVNYGDEIGIVVFFSVFGSKYTGLRALRPGRPTKISGNQFLTAPNDVLIGWNEQTICPIIASMPKDALGQLDRDRMAAITKMNLMYVSPYMAGNPNLEMIERFSDILGKPIGYSDHTPGVTACRLAIEHFGCLLVEKHFNLYSVQSFRGQVYRDSLHAADAVQLQKIAKLLT